MKRKKPKYIELMKESKKTEDLGSGTYISHCHFQKDVHWNQASLEVIKIVAEALRENAQGAATMAKLLSTFDVSDVPLLSIYTDKKDKEKQC